MCGRFVFYSSNKKIEEKFGIRSSLKSEPRYNISPTQYVAAIREENNKKREVATLRWGLIPSWSKNIAIGNHMFNARAETILEKPSFRSAFMNRRCIVLADGFYEWHKSGNKRIPYFISLVSSEPFALAAIWEKWTDVKTGETIQTTSVLTMASNDFMLRLHHRMPIIIESNAIGDWLTGKNTFFKNAMQRIPKLHAWQVTNEVNNSRNQGKFLINPVEKDHQMI
ncbi:MAG: DUF159 family protein [Gammaproteobacteria bacterium]|nr:DUF159 family protein [Gammaproteobacteria bacterium]|tara:strand:+ start:3679 stop:4353 length:675 start_codon:yes stop_codon:yes gene_type:complete